MDGHPRASEVARTSLRELADDGVLALAMDTVVTVRRGQMTLFKLTEKWMRGLVELTRELRLSV